MKRQNLILFGLAIIVGVIFSLHNLIPWWSAHQAGVIYTPFNNGDENIYAGQVSAAANGQLFSSEYSPSLPWVGPLILGLIAKLTGSVALVFILADFFLPIIIFYLLYLLAREFKISHNLALTGALASLFGYQLLTKINPLEWLVPMFFNFNRLIPPQLTFIFFLLFLISLYRQSVWSGWWAGIMAYVYFYHWSAAIIILAIFCFLTKNKKLFAGLVLGIIISSLYLYQASSATLEQQMRFGRLEGRLIEPLTSFRYLLLGGLVYFSQLSKTVKKFLLSILAAAILLMNLQLLIGFTIAPGHWPSSTFEPLAPFILVIIFSRIVNKRWRLFIGLILLYALINQIRISYQWRSMYWLRSGETELFNFINQQPDNPVVLTLDKRLNFFLPVMSKARVYLPYGSYSSISNDELWQRFICAMVISQLSDQEVEAKLNDTQLIGHLFDLTYNQGLTVFSFGQRRLSQEIKDWVRQEIASKPNCSFPFDYVILKDNRIYDARN